MDTLCLKAGIHGMAAPSAAAAGNVELRLSAAAAEKPSVSAAPRSNLAWRFTFRHPLRSLWRGSKIRLGPAIAVDDAVLAEEKDGIREGEGEMGDGNWVSKVLRLRTFVKGQEKDCELRDEMREQQLEAEGENGVEEKRNLCEENEECDGCEVGDDDGDKIEFDRESFSKLLRKVPLAESRLYAQLSYLGSLAYSIPQIKPGKLLRYHGLQFVTSSLEKKEQALNVEKEKESSEDQQKEAHSAQQAEAEGKRITASTAYQIAASAASYFHSRTKSILSFGSSNSMPNETDHEDASVDMMNLIEARVRAPENQEESCQHTLSH